MFLSIIKPANFLAGFFHVGKFGQHSSGPDRRRIQKGRILMQKNKNFFSDKYFRKMYIVFALEKFSFILERRYFLNKNTNTV
jgi:hypothetical protein